MNNSSTISQDIAQNGELSFYIDTFLMTTKVFCISVGIPLNVFVVKAIVRLLRLRYKSRYLFLLAVTFSYWLFFIPPVVEVIYCAILPPVCWEFVCQILAAISGLSHALLLLNFCLALIDRYIAINFPLMHRDKMTSRFAKVSIFVCNIFLTFHLKFTYIMGLVPLGCEIWLVHNIVLGLTMLILFVSCIILNLIVYQKTKTHFSESRTLIVDTKERLRTARRPNEVEMVVVSGRNISESRQLATYGSESLNVAAASFPIRDRITRVREVSVQGGKEILSAMEIEATRSLVFGMFSLIVTVCPIIVFLSTVFVCQLFSEFDCSHFSWLTPYFKEMVLVHAVYNPFIFLLKNEELKKTLMAIR